MHVEDTSAAAITSLSQTSKAKEGSAMDIVDEKEGKVDEPVDLSGDTNMSTINGSVVNHQPLPPPPSSSKQPG
jgi:hypothetical protein